MGNRHWTEEEDLLVLRCAGRSAGAVLAQRIGRSPLAVTQRAALLRHGRTARQRHVDQPRQGRDWTRAERERLRALAGRLGPETVATLLGRTPTAVRLQAKRLGLHWVASERGRRDHSGYTAREVATLLGLPCPKTVAWWITSGYLQGARSDVRQGPHRVWRVHPEALERFLGTYRWLSSPARIRDRAWRAFVEALPPEHYVGTAEAARLLCYEIGSIDALIARGDLAAEKHGPNWRVPLSAIRRFVPPPLGGRVPEEVRRRRAATLAARRPAQPPEDVA